jgi:ATP-dependent Lon protease
MGKKRSNNRDKKEKKRVKIEDDETKQGIITDDEIEDDQLGDQNENDTITFGDDEKIDSNELDEKGNIKDLFDYEDGEDYEEYEKEMKKREERIEKKAKKGEIAPFILPLIFTRTGGQSSPGGNNDLTKRIMKSGLPEKDKSAVLAKLKNSDMDKPKQMEWIESLLSIPFGVMAPTPVKMSDPQDKIMKFFKGAYEDFNQQVYGLNTVKDEIINYLAQFITTGNKTTVRPLAIYGNAGIGKTHIVRSALSKILQRHLCCINMGGIRDAAHFYGFSYTYSGSKYGVIAQQLMNAKVMNPIICFEEVDKISDTKEGLEIQNILMHLTDPEQNYAFQDKYFTGIDIDLSKAIIVFTLNNPELLDPILLNRLHLIKIPDPTIEDKMNIIRKHIYPKICSNIGFDPESLIIPDDILRYFTTQYNNSDKGLRTLKKNLETIILKLNTIKLIGCDLNGKLDIKFPLTLDIKTIDKIVTREELSNDIPSHMYM